MAAKLKVFTWSDGFHAFTVAATSRPKALEAWGSRQDLFASGLASPLTEGPDYDAALASPGEVIERGLTVDIGKVSKAERSSKSADDAKKTRTRAKARAKAGGVRDEAGGARHRPCRYGVQPGCGPGKDRGRSGRGGGLL